IQAIFLTDFRISLLNPETDQFENPLRSLIIDWRFNFHAGFLAGRQSWAFECQNCGVIAVPAETKASALLFQSAVEVEEFVALKTAGMSLSAEIHQPTAQRLNSLHAVLLFAFETILQNTFFELPSQVF